MMPDRADFTGTQDAGQIRWQPAEVTSPHLPLPVPVIAARDIPYIRNANRLQNLSIYLPRTPEIAGFTGVGPGPSTAEPPAAACNAAPEQGHTVTRVTVTAASADH
jgi:hypothetical protein